MIIFEEDSTQTLKREIPIPDKMMQYLQRLRKLYEPYIETTEGGKVLKQNTEIKVYNQKGKNEDNGKEKNKPTINVNVAKERLQRQNQFSPNSLEYILFGGQPMNDLLKKGIKASRRKNVVPEVPKSAKPSSVETSDTKPKGFQVSGGMISIGSIA